MTHGHRLGELRTDCELDGQYTRKLLAQINRNPTDTQGRGCGRAGEATQQSHTDMCMNLLAYAQSNIIFVNFGVAKL